MDFNMNNMAAADEERNSDEESSQLDSVASEDEESVFSSATSDDDVDSPDEDDEDDIEERGVDYAALQEQLCRMLSLRLAHDIITKLENNTWPEDEHILDMNEFILAHGLQAIDRFGPALRGNTAIRRIYLGMPEIFVEPESITKFSKLLATLVSLESVFLQYEGAPGMATVVEIVRDTRHIRKLSLCRKPEPDAGTGGELHAQRLADALRNHPALEECVMNHLSPDETRLVVTVFPTLSRLRTVLIESPQQATPPPLLHPEVLSQLWQVASLREVQLFNHTISKVGLKMICEGLRRDGSLVSKLTLSRCQFPERGFSLFANSLKYNTTLEHLCIAYCGPDSTFFSALKENLCANRTLFALSIYPDELSEKVGADLVAAVRNNYVLETCSACVTDSNQGSLLRCIPLLNHSGRGYLIEDPASITKGVQVLRNVIDDLDCLFLHLQENPLLCMPHKSPQQLTLGTKRKHEWVEASG